MKKSVFTATQIIGNYAIPQGITVIDSVSTKRHPLGAILVRHDATGLYGIWHAGVYGSVDQDAAQKYINTRRNKNEK